MKKKIHGYKWVFVSCNNHQHCQIFAPSISVKNYREKKYTNLNIYQKTKQIKSKFFSLFFLFLSILIRLVFVIVVESSNLIKKRCGREKKRSGKREKKNIYTIRIFIQHASSLHLSLSYYVTVT